ncbi:MAG: Y-family DNA polymerase [Deltaproteobacteria bacterium]|jgi:DNA polymerase V|nr:Y-family DNA polymerase [Deltaproteobacteria bacterium]
MGPLSRQTPLTPTLWALVDCESFYCSCERIFRPDLKGKPIAVLSNNDGCLVAMSPETKALGFQMGEPFFKESKRLEKAGVTVFSSNYALYGDISRRVMSSLESVVPDIRPYSIDEAFIPLSPALALKAEELGWEFLRKALTWVGVPTRVGLGPTRTMAKLANHWAKKKGRVFQLRVGDPEYLAILAETPAVNVWGVGRRLSQKLKNQGVDTALELSRLSQATAKRLLTVKGLKTVLELNGIQAIDDDLEPAPFKSLVSSRSFGSKVKDIGSLMESLAGHAATLGARLRAEGLVTPALSVFIGTAHYIDEPFHTGATVELPSLTNYTPTLIKAVRGALERCFRSGFAYARAGVMVYDLKPDSCLTERDLWAPSTVSPEKPGLMAALDRINRQYGRGTIKFSSQGAKNAPWRTRFDRLSKASTTAWEALPVVRA